MFVNAYQRKDDQVTVKVSLILLPLQKLVRVVDSKLKLSK